METGQQALEVSDAISEVFAEAVQTYSHPVALVGLAAAVVQAIHGVEASLAEQRQPFARETAIGLWTATFARICRAAEEASP